MGYDNHGSADAWFIVLVDSTKAETSYVAFQKNMDKKGA